VSLHKRDTSANGFKSDKSSNIGIALPTQKQNSEKPQFWPVFLDSGSQTIYALAVFTRRINGLTSAVFTTGEKRGFSNDTTVLL
jgi:hypothetical protein